MFPGLSGIARNLRAFPQVQMRDVRSLPPAEVAIASILAAGLWALQTRSWRRPVLRMKTARFRHVCLVTRQLPPLMDPSCFTEQQCQAGVRNPAQNVIPRVQDQAALRPIGNPAGRREAWVP